MPLLLACKISVEKSADSSMRVPLYVSLAFLFLPLKFYIFIYKSLGVGLFGYILFGTLSVLPIQ